MPNRSRHPYHQHSKLLDHVPITDYHDIVKKRDWNVIRKIRPNNLVWDMGKTKTIPADAPFTFRQCKAKLIGKRAKLKLADYSYKDVELKMAHYHANRAFKHAMRMMKEQHAIKAAKLAKFSGNKYTGQFEKPDEKELKKKKLEFPQYPPFPWPPWPSDPYFVKPKELPKMEIPAKTQKARGVKYLEMHGSVIIDGTFGTRHPHAIVFPHEPFKPGSEPFIKFMRPCPMRPRHGFVESRVVVNSHDFNQIWKETREADPDGELLIMDVLSGKRSAVLTCSGITWGTGHDGATGGEGKSAFIPTPHSPTRWKENIVPHSTHNVGIDHNLYVELVEHSEKSVVVQLRDGPVIPTTLNFVPLWAASVPVHKIMRIIKHETTLLGWETEVLDAIHENGGFPDGLCVHLPGMTLGSHWAVHAIQAGIPVITDQCQPAEGEVLTPTPGPDPLDVFDLERVRNQIERRRAKTLEKPSQRLVQAMATLHSMSLWDNSPHLLKLRAHMPVDLARGIAASCIGEDRHWWIAGPGSTHGTKPALAMFETNRANSDRNHVYKDVLAHDWDDLYRELKQVKRDFKTQGWRSSYGGERWVDVTRAGIKLMEAVNYFCWHPSQTNWKKVIFATNIAVNTVHNGGKCLNKWVDTDKMSMMGWYPVLGFMSQVTAKTVLGE